MIFSSITFLDFSNLSGFFIPIFNHCNIIPYNLGVLISYSCDVFISFSQLINLHDLINLSIYLTSSIFLIFACFALFTKPLEFYQRLLNQNMPHLLLCILLLLTYYIIKITI
jgi:hypothetical protein